jgi:hypothetical protein
VLHPIQVHPAIQPLPSIGWLALVVGAGNSDCSEMDMTRTVSFETLYDWDLEVAITDPNSIKNNGRKTPNFFC